MDDTIRSMYYRTLVLGFTYFIAGGMVQCRRYEKYSGRSGFDGSWLGPYFIKYEQS